MQILITSVLSNKLDLCFQLISKGMQILTSILKKWLQKLFMLILSMSWTNNMHHNDLKSNHEVSHHKFGAHHVMTPTIPFYFPLKNIRTLKNNDKIPTCSQQVLNMDYRGSVWTYVCFLAMCQIKDEYYCCYASFSVFIVHGKMFPQHVK